MFDFCEGWGWCHYRENGLLILRILRILLCKMVVHRSAVACSLRSCCLNSLPTLMEFLICGFNQAILKTVIPTFAQSIDCATRRDKQWIMFILKLNMLSLRYSLTPSPTCWFWPSLLVSLPHLQPSEKHKTTNKDNKTRSEVALSLSCRTILILPLGIYFTSRIYWNTQGMWFSTSKTEWTLLQYTTWGGSRQIKNPGWPLRFRSSSNGTFRSGNMILYSNARSHLKMGIKTITKLQQQFYCCDFWCCTGRGT